MYRVRTRTLNGGRTCSIVDNTPETIYCPVDCSWNWGNWDNCDAICDGIYATATGRMKRLFNITPEMYGGNPCDSQQMSQMYQQCTKTDCKVDCKHEYGNWGDCDATCDGINTSATGMMTRKLFNTISEMNGGICKPPEILQPCTKTDCKVDCSWNWSEWSPCNANTGQRTRTVNIAIYPSYNGIICPEPQTENCTIPPPITNISGVDILGNINTDNSTDKFMIFKTGTSSFTVQSQGIICDILMIGGGGSGGYFGGGGGAGACIVAIGHTLPGGVCNVTVGPGGTSALSSRSLGNNGGDSLISVNGIIYYRAKGGGRGAEITNNLLTNGIGADGGCGGGAGLGNGNGNIRSGEKDVNTNIVNRESNIGSTIKPNYVVLCNKGGDQLDNTLNNSSYMFAGGGGIGAAGRNHVFGGMEAGPGGDGLNNATINGVPYNFKSHFANNNNNGFIGGGGGGGGGGGASYFNSIQALGGFGGGGNGSSMGTNATIGVANTGSGGGGGGGDGRVGGGSGGSGIVIIRYRTL
jgi:hypothetical protein